MSHPIEQDDSDKTSQLQRSPQTPQINSTRSSVSPSTTASIQKPPDRDPFVHLLSSHSIDISCTCNQCTPYLYLHCLQNCLSGHDPRAIIIEPGQDAIIQQDAVKQHTYPRFEALYLVEKAIEYFDRPAAALGPAQINGLLDFQTQTLYSDFLERLGEPNCAKSVTTAEMARLMASLNQIFFLGAISPPMFAWETSLFAYGSCLTAQASIASNVTHLIRIDPEKVPCRETRRGEQRIGILLHEMVHAFLEQFVCHTCKTAGVNLRLAAGHGRAWHRLAAAVERVSSSFLGLGKLDLGRLNTLKFYWVPGGGMVSPSTHDLIEYGYL